MHVLILTLGTRGDLELFLLLGCVLARRGHRVTLASSPFFADRIRHEGLEFVPIGSGRRADLVALLRSLATVSDRHERTRAFARRWLRPQLREGMGQLTRAAAGADYFVSNLKLVMQRGDAVLPGAAVTYDPPHDVGDLLRYGTQDHGGRILDLVALSRPLIDPDHLWDARFHFTGFWNATDTPTYQPPGALSDFLAAGPPPVVLTMGSMVMFDEARLMEVLVAALHRAGQRGLVVGAWSDLDRAGSRYDEIFCIDEVPYGWLFPRASAVIHHGGCGTVAAVLRAGVPSVLLPQVTCQELIACALWREGLATGVFDTSGLRAEELAGAIARAATDDEARRTAQAWQQRVSAERGVEDAAERIEAHGYDLVE